MAVVIQAGAVARPELRHDGSVVPGQVQLLACNLRRWGEKDFTGGGAVQVCLDGGRVEFPEYGSVFAGGGDAIGEEGLHCR